MRNFRLLIEYDGTDYSGWQRQENGRTVQGDIETVLFRILQEKVNLIGSGRTDAGVHARGQVANFRSGTQLGPREILRGLNALLPEDILVREAEEVSPGVHARDDARNRTYTYLIALEPTAILRKFSWFVAYKLDILSMERAALALVGKHDYGSFCKAGSAAGNCICTVGNAVWQTGDSSFLKFLISADRFVHGMVRTLVGTMVDVGRNYTTYEEFLAIMEMKDRKCAGITAPAKGLVLEEVVY